jgi:DNA polymerase-1
MNNYSLEDISRICSPAHPGNRKLDAAKFYRDRWGWAIHPLCGPNSTSSKQGRGKRPLCDGWRRWHKKDVTDDFLEQHFGAESAANLGVVVRAPSVCVDLDSKADRGQSVRDWLANRPELKDVPRERSAGGVHLHFVCRDLPAIKKKGKPYEKALVSHLTEKVTAELFFDGLNLVVSPSVHASGPTYDWEVVTEIPEVSWTQLKEWFGFKLPDEENPEVSTEDKSEDEGWWLSYEGDLSTLDLLGLFKSFDMLGETVNADKGTVAVKCPWFHEHSENERWDPKNSSTTIFTKSPDAGQPGFSCLHSHCNDRGLRDVLAYFEEQRNGCVDAHCRRLRVWKPGQTSEDGRPRLPLPRPGRPDSVFAIEAANLINPKQCWFLKSDQVVKLHKYKESEKLEYLGFAALKPVEVCTAIEVHVEVGTLNWRKKEQIFVPNSMKEQTAKLLIYSPQFKEKLPAVVRILDVPLPIFSQDEIVYPSKGYDSRFHSFCDKNAPDINITTSIEEGLSLLRKVLEGFCWMAAQDLVHAVASFLTPFCRGLMGWDARFPLWLFEANRPRAGKDYLAGARMLIHQGHLCEDAPIGEDEEMRKRITTGVIHGRRMMHFANCRGFLDSSALEHALTSKVWSDRILGGNTDAKAPNEIEFSLSANTGLTYTADLGARMRKIRLAYPQEDANSRKFPITDLHGWVLQHRSELLSALAALVTHWERNGCPSGPTPFTSFPEWGRVVGGIMVSCNLGNPCLPHPDEAEVGGDRLTRAMKDLFGIWHQAHKEEWLEKAQIYDVVEKNQEVVESLELFGDLSEGGTESRSARTKLGLRLRQFVGRVLGGLQLQAETPSNRTERAKYRLKQVNDVSDHGSRVVEDVLGAANSFKLPVPNGTVGDLGDVCPLEIITENPSKIEKAASVETYTQKPAAPKVTNVSNVTAVAPTLVTAISGLGEIIDAVNRSEAPIGLDIETYGRSGGDALNPRKGEIRLLSLAIPGHNPWLIDLKAIGYDFGPFRPVLEDAQIIGHNLKFDVLWLRTKCGLRLNRLFCTMTASRLLTAGTNLTNDLGECLRRHVQIDLPKDEATSDWGVVLNHKQLQYAANDVLHLHRLKAALEHEVEKHNLKQTLDLELALLPVVVDMEFRGVGVNRDGLVAIKAAAEVEAKSHEAEMHRLLTDSDFNPASPAQVLRALQVRGNNITKTNEETLVGCRDELAKLVLEFRAANKKVEQAVTLLEALTPDGRIHATFNPLGADTGRFSSSKPNLQNVGRALRECFAAAPGNRLVVADYSQIELRVAAAISGEQRMLEAYNLRADLHKQTASLVTKKPMDQISNEDRRLAKAVNFGLLYGQSANGLVRYARTGYGVELSEQQATQMRQLFFANYTSLQVWHRKAWNRARQTATEVRTVIDRRRLLPTGADESWNRFTSLVNTPVQGGSADALKLAMVDLARRLPQGAGIVSTVHDELIVETPETLAEEVKSLVVACMLEAMKKLFPTLLVEVEAKVCVNWGEK